MKKFLKSYWLICVVIIVFTLSPPAVRYGKAVLRLPQGTIAEHAFDGLDSTNFDFAMISTYGAPDLSEHQYAPEVLEQVLGIIGEIPINAEYVSKKQWKEAVAHGGAYMVMEFNNSRSLTIDITKSDKNIIKIKQYAKKSWKHPARPINQTNYFTTKEPIDIDKLYEALSGGVEMGVMDWGLRSLQKMSQTKKISWESYIVNIGDREYSGGFGAKYPEKTMIDALNKAVIRTLPVSQNEQISGSPIVQTTPEKWSVMLRGYAMVEDNNGVSEPKRVQAYFGTVRSGEIVMYVSCDTKKNVAVYSMTQQVRASVIEKICTDWVALE